MPKLDFDRNVGRRGTHYQRFDSLEELLSQASNSYQAKTNEFTCTDSSWTGRYLPRWQDCEDAARQPWPEGRQLVDGMLRKISANVTMPTSIRKRARLNDEEGSIMVDRLFSGEERYRRTYKRENRQGIKNLTVIVDTCALGDVPHREIMWRGAAGVALTHLLEQAGYTVELWTIRRSNMVYPDSSSVCTATKLKSLGDGCNIGSFIAACSGWFYRSVMFTVGASEDRSASAGGSEPPWDQDLDRITTDKGRVLITGVHSEEDAVELVQDIMVALNGGDDSHRAEVQRRGAECPKCRSHRVVRRCRQKKQCLQCDNVW